MVITAFSAVIFNLNNSKMSDNKIIKVSSFEECVSAGYPIMESYLFEPESQSRRPEQCKTPDGRNFVRQIIVTQADFNAPITLSVDDSATFSDGLKITLFRLADSHCPSGNVCVFTGEITAHFQITDGNIASQKEFSLGTQRVKNITINGYTFMLESATKNTATITAQKQTTQIRCFVGGCSGEICSEKEDIISICVYKKEYSCYKTAQCERQSNGQCEWTKTAQLQACLGGNANSGEYICALPCSDPVYPPSLTMQCSQQKTKEQCLSVKTEDIPQLCQWRKADYVCPSVP